MPIHPNISDTQTHAVNLRVRTEIRVLIDQAAKAQGKTRPEFSSFPRSCVGMHTELKHGPGPL